MRQGQTTTRRDEPNNGYKCHMFLLIETFLSVKETGGSGSSSSSAVSVGATKSAEVSKVLSYKLLYLANIYKQLYEKLKSVGLVSGGGTFKD